MAPERDNKGLLAAVARRATNLRAALQRQPDRWRYQDDVVRMDDDGIVIRRYYWPGIPKRVAYADIANFTPRALKAWQGQYRVHGLDVRGRWYSHDRHRGEKEMAIDLDIGRPIRPVLTPLDPDAVVEILSQKVRGEGSSDNEPHSAEPPDADDPDAWLL